VLRQPQPVWLSFLALCIGFFVPSFALAQGDNSKSSDEAKAVYSDAANFQNNQSFDLAAEEWEKFISRFPKDPLAAKATNYAGVCYLQLKQYEKAADKFAAVVKSYPNFDLAEEAHLNWGWSLYSSAQASGDAAKAKPLYEKAASALSEMIDRRKEGKLLDQANFFLGESLYRLGKKEEAIAPYAKVVNDFATSKMRKEALYALGVAQEETKKFADAIATYDKLLTELKEGDLYLEARLRRADCLLQKGDFAPAETEFAVLAAVKGFAQADFALQKQAVAASRQQKNDLAAQIYANLAERFPKSPFAGDALLNSGRSFYRAKEWDKAWAPLAQVSVGTDKVAAEASHWLARIALVKGDPAKALEVSTSALRRIADTVEFYPQLMLDQADALYEAPSRRAESIDRYLAIVKGYPKSEVASQALYDAIFALKELTRPDEALALANQFSEQFPQDKLLPDVLDVVGQCRLLKQDFAGASKVFSQLISQYPTHALAERWSLRQGLSLHLEGKNEPAREFLSQALRSLKDPEAKAEAHYLMGAAALQLDRADDAVRELSASLAEKADWRQADETLLLLSRAQKRANDLPGAIATARKLISAFPNSAVRDQAEYRLGEYQQATGDFASAAKQFDLVLSQYPKSTLIAYAQYGKGWCAMQQEAFKEAIASFTALIDGHPGHALEADSRFARGVAKRRLGELQPALVDISAYLATNPALGSRADALLERARIEAALKNYTAAAATLAVLAKENPKYAQRDRVLYDLAWAHKNGEQPAETIDTFQMLVAEFPNGPLAAEAYFHLGEDAYDKKDYKAAQDSYNKCRAAGAKDELAEKATYKLAWASYQLGEFEASQAAFAEQVKAFPRGSLLADGLFMNGESLFKLKKWEAALVALDQAQPHIKGNDKLAPLGLLHAGQSALQLQKATEAIGYLSQIPTSFADSPYLAEAHFELGRAAEMLKKPDDASKNYEIAAEKSRGEVGARARFMLGELQFGRKAYDDAVKHFQRVMFGFGGDQANEAVKIWQAQSGYEAGRCTEVQIAAAPDAEKKAKLIADSKRFYQYVVDKHSASPLAKESQKRLDILARL
jgi:cellulose synthase operon protein C